MTDAERLCARAEAAERLAELGFADPEEIGWWLAWADRRRDDVRGKLADGLRDVLRAAERHEGIAGHFEDRLSAQHAREIGRAARAALRRAGLAPVSEKRIRAAQERAHSPAAGPPEEEDDR